MSTFKTLKAQARRKALLAKAKAIASKKPFSRKATTVFITRQVLAESAERMTDEQRAQLREARARAEALLAKPSMSADALRARARRASDWEKSHGTITAFAGTRR